MDILRDAWIPTDAGVLSPLDALRQGRRVTWPRGDWNAATLMFLHALVQTGVVVNDTCPDIEAWIEFLETPPDDLDEWIDGLNAGPDPWQCMTAEKNEPVAALIPESPRKNTLKESKDIMLWKESAVSSLTITEALIAVISTQFWGIPGGSGYPSGCRGQYPLTLMVEPDSQEASLWQRIWMNVLPKDLWLTYTRDTGKLLFDFPWKHPLPKESVTPQNANPLEMLWQMPRRWRIVQDEDGLVRRMKVQNNGREYENWLVHPLTAYKPINKAGTEFNAVKTSTHVGFREWASLAVGLAETGIRVPIVVNHYLQELSAIFNGHPIRLHCFGWAGSDFGPGAWVDQVVPFYVNVNHAAVEQAVHQAEKVHKNLAGRLASISSYLGAEADRLHADKEAEFYGRVRSGQWDGWEMSLRRRAREILWDVAETHRHDPFATARMVSSL